MDRFINNFYITLNLKPHENIQKEQARLLLYELVKGHGYEDEWCDKQFDEIYALFDQDDPNEDVGGQKQSGLDK